MPMALLLPWTQWGSPQNKIGLYNRTQCKPCSDCFAQSTPIFDPSLSSSYKKLPYSHALCSTQALPEFSCKSNGCENTYTYGNFSIMVGILSSETFTFSLPKSTAEPSQAHILFGCGHDNEKGGFDQASRIDISVGKTLLSIPNGAFDIQSDRTGGFIIDSGTTITYFPLLSYGALKKELGSLIKFTRADGLQVGLDLYYKVSVPNTSLTTFPSMTFHLKGVHYALPPKNYMVSTDNRGKFLCLAMLPSDDGISIFGNVQQQNYQIIYDLRKYFLSFSPALCETISIWILYTNNIVQVDDG